MNAIETLKQDVLEGRVDTDQLIDLVVVLQRQLQTSQQQHQGTQQQLKSALVRIEQLEKKFGGAPTKKLDQPYSLRAEEQRQKALDKQKKKTKQKRQGRRGRIKAEEKLKKAERIVPVYPEGVPPEACKLSHTRVVWQLENGRTVLVGYEVYRGPKNKYGKIPGALGRSEFSLGILAQITFYVHIIGLSFDKTCLCMNFNQQMDLKKSQVDALLSQLSRHLENEFDILCTLVANSLVVHTDETSWSINSVWAFLSEKARVLLFGVHKDADTLKKILDPETFKGIAISDDAAVYANFTHAQKCWAHLIRKAIKLKLQEPENTDYCTLTDRLLEIYHEARRLQSDGRLSDAGRARKVIELENMTFDLCAPMWAADLPPLRGIANDYRLLMLEVFRLGYKRELFTFVTAKPVELPNGTTKPVDGTNNEPERTLRNPAQARDTGRTSKTMDGCRRKSILTSVLESLRLYLKTFTLSSVIDELNSWMAAGRSCFERLLKNLNLKTPEKSYLDRFYPIPDPSPTG
jgi:transposase